MEWEIALLGYLSATVFLLMRNEWMAYREIKGFQCTKKFTVVEYYECKADGYYSYMTLNGKRFLFVGDYEDRHAYYHELGHLVFDIFWLDAVLAALILVPILFLPAPWAWMGAFIVYVAVKWVKKNWERRADIFAYEMTKQKYTPIQLEKDKITLLYRWLFWSHPPEKVRIMNEYYKKEIPLIKLFFKSFSS
jgi:hypothetical protein